MVLPRDFTLSVVIKKYKTNAAKRKLRWELSNEEAKDLLLSNCYYCNVQPCSFTNIFINKKGELTAKGRLRSKKVNKHDYTVYVNGIDRVDSSLSYTTDNVVPCCTICNRAKSNISMASFLLWLSNLVSYRSIND